MKEFEEKQVTQKIVTKYICDKCQNEIETTGDYTLTDKFKVVYAYNAWGDYWVDFGFEIEDLCLNCCKELKILLVKNGYRVKDL